MEIKGGSGKKTKYLDVNEKEEKENMVCIIYADHVLYRNMNNEVIYPIIRKTIGWIIHENRYFLQICWDKSIKNQEKETSDGYSGLTILKNDILEISYIKIQNLKISEIPSYVT